MKVKYTANQITAMADVLEYVARGFEKRGVDNPGEEYSPAEAAYILRRTSVAMIEKLLRQENK